MNCWLILLLLCCSGRNNGIQNGALGCGENEHHGHYTNCHNSCIQPRMCDNDSCDMRNERKCECNERDSSREDTCPCSSNERIKERWMPYTECSDNDRREYQDSCKNECNCK